MSVLHAIFHFLCDIFLGCSHDHLTRPFTLEQRTYKVCLDCGKQLFYSAESMRPLSTRELRRLRTVQSGELKVVPAAAASLNDENGSRAVA